MSLEATKLKKVLQENKQSIVDQKSNSVNISIVCCITVNLLDKTVFFSSCLLLLYLHSEHKFIVPAFFLSFRISYENSIVENTESLQ